MTNYWAIANFQTHLKRSHKLVSATSKFKVSKVDDEIANENDSIEVINNNDKIENDIETISTGNSTNDSEHVYNELLSKKRTAVKIEKKDNWFYDQLLATQINSKMQAVLMNVDNENRMTFQLEKNVIYDLMVVTILGDGNCLFAAIAHQLSTYPANSTEHKQLTKRLRSEVVEYILNNFESFEHILKNRVYDLKNASEITDMSTECKLNVRHILSRNGQYGGYESVKALSEIYEVNIDHFLRR